MRYWEKKAAKYLKKRGYKISAVSGKSQDGYSLFEYDSYDQYRETQIAGNKRKINNVFTDEATIGAICDYLRPFNPKRGLCHGARNAAEVRWFREGLGIEVIGTDISDTARDYGLVQWDFHDHNPEWDGRFDFVYSNSFDHSYDPKKMFNNWISQLSEGGKLILEHSSAHEPANLTKLDPFGVEGRVLPYTILAISKGGYFVTNILQSPEQKYAAPNLIFVIEKLTN